MDVNEANSVSTFDDREDKNTPINDDNEITIEETTKYRKFVINLNEFVIDKSDTQYVTNGMDRHFSPPQINNFGWLTKMTYYFVGKFRFMMYYGWEMNFVSSKYSSIRIDLGITCHANAQMEESHLVGYNYWTCGPTHKLVSLSILRNWFSYDL